MRGAWGDVTGVFTSRRLGSCCHLSASSALVGRWFFSECTCPMLEEGGGMSRGLAWSWRERRGARRQTALEMDIDASNVGSIAGKIGVGPGPRTRAAVNSRSWHGTRWTGIHLPGFRPESSPHPPHTRHGQHHETKHSASADILTSTDILVQTSAARLDRLLRAHRSGHFPACLGARTLTLDNPPQHPHRHQRVHHASTSPPPHLHQSRTRPLVTSPRSGLAVNYSIPLANDDNRHDVANSTGTTHHDFRPGLHAPS